VPRLLSLDALRGVAVVLMMEQHLGVWLWHVHDPTRTGIAQAPFYMALNGLGGLAAPTFITLAGAGTSLLVASRTAAPGLPPDGPNLDLTLVRRGLVLLGFGYLLNWLTPSWFSWGSWFVLHLMGFAIATAPLWRRLPTAALVALEFVLLGVTVAAQHVLRTPALLTNDFMRDLGRPGGALRVAFVEGQFPILPWLGVFLGGMAVGRWLVAERPERIGNLCRLCLAGGITLMFLGLAAAEVPALAFLRGAPWWRVVSVRTSFYPAGPGIVLLLQAGVLLMLSAALHIERSKQPHPGQDSGVLVCLGRASLTLLLVHVVLFREISRPLGAWQAFSWPVALLIIAGWIALCAVLARAWQRHGYRFGAEWLLRRLGG
jgi:uncharacterized membrane protein